MPQWIVRPSDRSLRHPWYQCDDAGAAAILKRWKSKPRPVDLVQEEANELWIDGGGAVSYEEPKRRLDANGVRFGFFLRHVPFVLPVLKRVQECEKTPGCVVFQGWLCYYILSFATRDALVEALEKIVVEEGEAIKELERSHAERVNSVQGSVYQGKCSCGSDKLYTDCCGSAKRN